LINSEEPYLTLYNFSFMINTFLRKAKRAVEPQFWLFKWQRSVTGLPLRKASINIIKRMLGNRPVTGAKMLDIRNIEEHVLSLKSKGFTNLGQLLSQSQVEAIKAALKNYKCFDPYNKAAGQFDPAQAPLLCHTAHYQREDLIKNDIIINIANDSAILKIVQEVLGAVPTISNINCWWSFAGRSKAEHAQLFHRDVDDFKFLKLFVYLTDVTSTDGPHIYVSGSHDINKATQIRRYQDDEIKATFGEENIKSFEEPQGSLFLVDTFGIHKGMLPQKNDRLLLQVQYSLLPLYVESYQPVNLPMQSDLDHYVNRLLLKQEN